MSLFGLSVARFHWLRFGVKNQLKKGPEHIHLKIIENLKSKYDIIIYPILSIHILY